MTPLLNSCSAEKVKCASPCQMWGVDLPPMVGGGGWVDAPALETVVFLFHLLSTTSKPFSSLSTRLAHAVRLVFFLQKSAI